MAIPRFPSGWRSAAQVLLAQIATPSTPTGENALYAKSDGQLYTLNPAGVESALNDSETFPYGYSGPLTVRIGVLDLPLSASYRLIEVRARVGTAPTGASVIADVNKNDVTIFGTQANRPTVAAGTNNAVVGAATVTTFAPGDFLSVDIDQVGSTVAGSDLVVAIRLQRTA